MIPIHPLHAAALALALAAASAIACGKSAAPTADPPPTTPNAFLARGTPTFVLGTLGDARADRDLRGQVELVRQLFFPDAPLVTDDALADDLPDHPVVYGGPHVNALVRRLAPGLPFSLGPDRLVIGEHTLAGPDLQLITVLPARTEPPSHPELLLYAGTGTPGVAEINAVTRGDSPLVVADAFGPRLTGRWVRGPDGALAPSFDPPARRIAWRDLERTYARYRFPAEIAAADNEGELIVEAERGVARALERLGLPPATTPALTLYVYPDLRSKQALTGNAADGHAVPVAHALHIIGRADVARIADLVAHEATHALAWHAFGAPGTPLLGEGLAVWVAGGYGGVPLTEWRARLDGARHPPLRELLGPAFRKTPERIVYPLAGLVVEAAVTQRGLAAVTSHLYGATAATWNDACARAGLDLTTLESALP